MLGIGCVTSCELLMYNHRMIERPQDRVKEAALMTMQMMPLDRDPVLSTDEVELINSAAREFPHDGKVAEVLAGTMKSYSAYDATYESTVGVGVFSGLIADEKVAIEDLMVLIWDDEALEDFGSRHNGWFNMAES